MNEFAHRAVNRDQHHHEDLDGPEMWPYDLLVVFFRDGFLGALRSNRMSVRGSRRLPFGPAPDRLRQPLSYHRLAVRRATPPTLTGVKGRPTLASAVETKLCTPGVESRSPSSIPPSQMITASSMKPTLFNTVILHLPSQNSSEIHLSSRQYPSNRFFWPLLDF